MPEVAERSFYRFGRFRLDPTGRVLFRGDTAIRLPPKAADTLLLLLQNAGNVVDKQELLKRVWQDAFVEEGSLTRAISVLRKALQEAGGREFISTVAKRGYRFAAPVIETPGRPARAAAQRSMLVVLPFENLSNARKHDYFSEGMTEEMITRLARLNPERLGVIARTSSMQYKSSHKTVRQIGRSATSPTSGPRAMNEISATCSLYNWRSPKPSPKRFRSSWRLRSSNAWPAPLR